MDSLPPNDPNNNRNNDRVQQKEIPYDSRSRRNGRNRQSNAEPMDVMGDLRDSPVVMVMFLVGVASWLLRERCTC